MDSESVESESVESDSEGNKSEEGQGRRLRPRSKTINYHEQTDEENSSQSEGGESKESADQVKDGASIVPSEEGRDNTLGTEAKTQGAQGEIEHAEVNLELTRATRSTKKLQVMYVTRTSGKQHK